MSHKTQCLKCAKEADREMVAYLLSPLQHCRNTHYDTFEFKKKYYRKDLKLFSHLSSPNTAAGKQ